MSNTWSALPATAQDLMVLALLCLPAILIGLAVLRGYRTWPLVRALIWRFRGVSAVFMLLIAVSVAMGIGLTAQERGLRRGTAQAADKFDLIVAAPGSEMTMLLATVFLQPADVPLLDGDAFAEIAGHDHVDLAAPLAFGDSFAGTPIVGTTADFVRHLTDDRISGRVWSTSGEAVIGASVALDLGAAFIPAHGTGDAADATAHGDSDEDEGHGNHLTVTGRMAVTGTPWDRAILVPIETVWETHGLANGHAPAAGQLGPPFDADYFPGTPAVIIRAHELWANYALRSALTRDDQMAFFPGTVLAQLYAVIGDVRQAMSVMALVAQGLVAASVMSALVILTRLFQRQLALLRAIGAPGRFVMAVVWCFAAVLVTTGAIVGLVLGYGATAVLAELVSARTGISVSASLGWAEIHLIAGFVSITSLLALGPALAVLRQSVTDGLKA